MTRTFFYPPVFLHDIPSELFALSYHAAVSASNLGSTGGEKTHTLKKAELPANLTGYITMHSANTGTNVQTAGGVFSKGTNLSQFRAGGELVDGASSTGQINFNLGGIGQAISIMPPWIVVCAHIRAG